MTKPSLQVDRLSKFLSYILQFHPDEFGIVPDADGFVKVKELLQVLHEEQGWRHIRMAHLNEALITPAKPVIEIDNNRIRAVVNSQLPVARQPEDLPKLLYIAIRTRAYAVTLDKGLIPSQPPHLILSSDMPMALRMGRRLDNHPTILTVHVAQSIQMGTRFRQYGRLLFLADAIHAGTFSGPALPKEKTDGKTGGVPAIPTQVKTPGSYFPDLDSPRGTKHQLPPGSRRKEPEWKKARRQGRKHKVNLNKS